jgi:acyl carrier protein
MTTAANKALAVMSNVCQVPVSKLKPEMHLIRDLALDSAITMELLMALESELSLEISDLEAAQLVTVGDVLAFINERLPPAST